MLGFLFFFFLTTFSVSMEMIRRVSLCSCRTWYIDRLLQTIYYNVPETISTYGFCYRFHIDESFCSLLLCARQKETKDCCIFCNHLLGFRIIYLSVKCLTRVGSCLGIRWGASAFLPLGMLGPGAFLKSILEHFFFRKLILLHFQYIYIVLQYGNLGF